MPTPAHRIPLNTYRLQLHAGFTFADAEAQLDYLADLGITDLYLSPILEAVPGSTHGYDMVDPTRISEERGGRAGFEALADGAHARGIGIVVDIVPNHMAIPTPLWLNPALWSVLRDGPDSPYADWFDIEPGASLVLPNIAMDASPPGSSQDPDDPIPALIASGQLRFADLRLPDGATERILTLDDHPYPLALGTANTLAEAVAAQRYSLQRWQGNHTRLTHRRFFDIVTLIGIRQELPEVFDATHALLLELFRAGHIDGLRVDHPDGLADPQGYFERLDAATGGAWVAAEKILSGDELLPRTWPVAGTTGYEASWRFDAVQLDPAAAVPLAELALTTDEQPRHTWPEVASEAKRFIADGSLAIDVDRLAGLAGPLDPGLDASSVRRCLREFLVALDRYRAYVRPGHPTSDTEAGVLADAARRARATLSNSDHPTLERLHALATSTSTEPPAAEFAVRFQQVSGALVAKGVEDTAFYRWTQLLTLCEVGGDPGTFGLPPGDGLHSRAASPAPGMDAEPTGPADLHTWLGRINQGWPATMSSGSTHDSKRSEDVRARIAAISEYPDEWAELVDALNPLAGELPAPLRTILWQTLAGTWTAAGSIDPDRIATFLVKAGREQKLWTSWVSPNHDAEAAAAGAVPTLLADLTVRRAFDDWVELTRESVRTNTLATKLVQLTALGVADLYQGQETVRLSLTDPDNRRAVDFGALRGSLAATAASKGAPNRERSLAEEKLLLTHLALELRKRHPGAFLGGNYLPLESTTRFAWGFARGDEPRAITIATRLPRRRDREGGWQTGDRLGLPPGAWRNLLTGREHTAGFRPGTDLQEWPCALLEQIG
ncbi:MAG: malto-oligosyltrehalose synthase [Propionicimonas sp.]